LASHLFHTKTKKMTNRKKRLKKGIKSLKEQIELHEEKKEKAREKGKIELEGYYKRELKELEFQKQKKIRLLKK